MTEFSYSIPWSVGIPTVFPQTKNDHFLDVLVFNDSFKDDGDDANYMALVCFQSGKPPSLTWHHEYSGFARMNNNIDYKKDKQTIIDQATSVFFTKFPHLK